MSYTPLTYTCICFTLLFTSIAYANKKPYLNNRVIVKCAEASSLKHASASAFSLEALQILQRIGAREPEQMFPRAYPPLCKNCVDISRIYRITYSEHFDPAKVAKALSQSAGIAYAQPEYCNELCYVPNDPKLNLQYQHAVIGSYLAWDSIRADSTITIGIIDTGTDIDHEDLERSIAYNYSDPINGIDDDNDGYIDNFRGWDLAENDNNPDIDESDHGTWVSGLAAATAGNGLGVAGSSYGAKFLPIKIATKYGSLTKTWEAIVYAADHGCQIINCSWGNQSKEPLGQDIVNYATFNRGALIVAAAGNNSTQEAFYPASYRHVLSVGGTVQSDEKWSVDNSLSSKGSSWGYFVDLCAPAAGYYSTTNNNSYAYIYGGTSFACPIVSGAAALVKAAFPELGPLAIAEQLKSHCDRIDTITYNNAYKDMLGTGRLNSHLSVNGIDKPGLVQTNYHFDKTPPYLPGDTLTLSIEIANYLATAKNVVASIEFNTTFISPLQSSFSISEIGTNDTAKNENQTFKFIFTKELPLDFEAVAKLVFSTEQYRNYEYISIRTNPSSLDHTQGDINTTITANGRIGFTMPDIETGLGINYKSHKQLLSEGGIIICEASNKVASSFLGEQDFSIRSQAIQQKTDSSDYKYIAEYFSDYLEIGIKQTTELWSDKNYIINSYVIKNYSNQQKPSIIFGNYYDWDIGNSFNNQTIYNPEGDISISYSTEPNGLYIGTSILTSDSSTIYATKNNGLGDGNVNLTIDDSDLVRYYCMTVNRKEQAEGVLGTDISVFHSTKPFSLDAGDTISITYATVFGEDQGSILSTISHLKHENGIKDTVYTHKTFSPEKKSFAVYPTITDGTFFITAQSSSTFAVFNNSGYIVLSGSLALGANVFHLSKDMPQGIYYIAITGEGRIIHQSIIKR